MSEPVYTERTALLLAASRQRADRTEQTTRQTAVRCAWCGQPVTNAPCCGAEPWRLQ